MLDSGARLAVTDEMQVNRRRAWLLLILAGGAALRAYHISWGLPEFVFFDTRLFFARPAWRILDRGDWAPETFVHPPALTYLIATAAHGWMKLTGGSLPPASNLAPLVMVGRVLTLALSTASIGAVYLLGRRLIGTRAALLAAAGLALTPVHVLEAHRVHADAPMILLSLLAAHQAVIARDTGWVGRLSLSFALAGGSGGFKYTGLTAGSVPAWIALTWRGRSFRGRLLLCLVGGLVTAAVFLLAIVPMLLEWDAFVHTARLLFVVGMRTGQAGENLVGDRWFFVPYVYPSMVALPYVMGWATYLSGLVGLGMLLRSKRARGPVFAAVVPFFLLQGGAATVTPRYYLPLAPYLCLGAGYALEALRHRRPRLGVACIAVVVGYGAALTTSHCLRIQDGTRRRTAQAIETLRRDARAAGKALVLGYPKRARLIYDPLRPLLSPTVRFSFLPPVRARARWSREQILERYREWLDRETVGAVLVPSWQEDVARRGGLGRAETTFFRGLEEGAFDFDLVLDERTHFFTEGLYTWGDPVFGTFVPAGIIGHKLYVRPGGARSERSAPSPSRHRSSSRSATARAATM